MGVSFKTELGQLLDLTSQPNTKVNNLDLFTLDTYKKIVEYKTAYYSFYLPVALAMHMGGIATTENLKVAEKILLQMGEYFQAQDDYLDCFGDPKVIGKIGTDIEDNKCGRLICKGLQKMSDGQKAVLSENYGKKDAARVAKVKALYREIDVESDFKAYENESYAKINGMIEKQTHVPKSFYTKLLKKIYKR